jgi:hypothetical protein
MCVRSSAGRCGRLGLHPWLHHLQAIGVDCLTVQHCEVPPLITFVHGCWCLLIGLTIAKSRLGETLRIVALLDPSVMPHGQL